MDRQDFTQVIRQALTREMPYLNGELREKLRTRFKQQWNGEVGVAGDVPERNAAVLALLASDQGDFTNPKILLLRRSLEIASHPGQISFPGGVIDPDDDSVETASLRETEEEVGIPRDAVELVGRLPELMTFSSRFWICPRVGILKPDPQRVPIRLQLSEIEEAWWVPLRELVRGDIFRLETFEIQGHQIPSPVFLWQGHRIWGATGMMIFNLLKRMEWIES